MHDAALLCLHISKWTWEYCFFYVHSVRAFGDASVLWTLGKQVSRLSYMRKFNSKSNSLLRRLAGRKEKQIMKQLCTLKVLLIALCYLSMSVKSYAVVYSGSCGMNVNWSLDTETELLEITGSGEMEDFGFCEAPWYNYRFNIKECVIENGVTRIGNYAFYYCTILTNITIPNSVTSIGGNVFDSTPWYDNQKNGVVYIGKVCYGYKGNMPENTIIIIKEGITEISEGAFYGYTGLTSITIPESVTKIGSSAFCNCTELINIIVPSSVTSIGMNAFEGTAWYNNQPNGIVYVGPVFYKYKGEMSEDNSITIKVGTISITGGTFGGARNLSKVVSYAPTIPMVTATASRHHPFRNISKDAVLYYPKGSDYSAWSSYFSEMIEMEMSVNEESIYRGKCGECVCWDLDKKTGTLSITGSGDMYDFSSNSPWYEYREFIKQCVMEEGITRVGNHAFKGCFRLINFTIPKSVKSIGEWAFNSCLGLTNIIIPENVISIGTYAFSGCTGLTNISINNGVASIGSCVFNACGVTNITIPESVTHIGAYAFQGCFGLTDVKWNAVSCAISPYTFYGIKKDNITSFTFGEKVETIPDFLCYGLNNLTNITIPESVTSIGDYAFENCTGLTSITIPNSVTSIGECTFRGCTGLTDITIPESVTCIGPYALRECVGLTNINIPNSVTFIEHGAFWGCTGVKEIRIGAKVEKIDSYVFFQCPNLSKIEVSVNNQYFCDIDGVLYSKDGKTLLTCPEQQLGIFEMPNNVIRIDDGAFYDCVYLTSVKLSCNLKEISPGAFYNCSGLTIINIPKSVLSIGNDAFYGCI